MKEQGIKDKLFGSQHFGGKRVCWSSKMGLKIIARTWGKPAPSPL